MSICLVSMCMWMNNPSLEYIHHHNDTFKYWRIDTGYIIYTQLNIIIYTLDKINIYVRMDSSQTRTIF